MTISLASVKTTPDVANAGQIADLNEAVIVSRRASAAIDFGVAVRNTGLDTCAPISGTGQVVAGISVRDVKVVTGASTVNYAAGDAVAVVEIGRVYAIPFEDVTAGDAVYARAADGVLGKTSSGNVAVPGAKWEQTVTAASGLPGRIRINLPG